MKIVVLAGGLSPERNVSLSSGTMITHALRSLGHQAALVDMYFGLEDYDGPLEAFFDRDVTDRWKQVDPKAPDLEAVKRQRKWKSPNQFGQGVLELCQMADIVFLAFHGTCGEDGRVQAAFDLMGIPYTGAGYLGSAIAMDKDFTKRLIAGLDVDTPKWRRVEYTMKDIDSLTSTTPRALRGEARGQRVLHRRFHCPHEEGAVRRPGEGFGIRRPLCAGAVRRGPGDPGGHLSGQGPALHRDHPQRWVL